MSYLWATVMQVACTNSVRMVFWIAASVSRSTAAVAWSVKTDDDMREVKNEDVNKAIHSTELTSSMMMIFALDNSALAIHKSCLWPTE